MVSSVVQQINEETPMADINDEEALRDPWAWVLNQITLHNWTSAYLATETGISRTTLRSLYNGRNPAPRYVVLKQLLGYCIDHYHEAPVCLASGVNPGALPAKRCRGEQ